MINILVFLLGCAVVATSAYADEINPFNPTKSTAVTSNISTPNPASKLGIRQGSQLDPSSKSQPEEGREPIVEKIKVVRIGSVNGEHIFRGEKDETYLFESTKKHKLTRIPVNAFESDNSDSSASSNYPPIPPTFNPSSSGRFNPTNMRGLATGYSQPLPPSLGMPSSPNRGSVVMPSPSSAPATPAPAPLVPSTPSTSK